MPNAGCSHGAHVCRRKGSRSCMRLGASSARTSSRARTSHRSRIRPWTAMPCVLPTPRSAPVRLDVVGSVAAGHLFEGTVGPGQAVRIMTGAPFPEGADAVCMVENTQDVDSSAVTIMESVTPGQFVRLPGRDVCAGTLLAGAGTALTPAHLGDLANQGVTEVMAHRHPRVGVLSTGDELFAGAGRSAAWSDPRRQPPLPSRAGPARGMGGYRPWDRPR